MNVKSRKSENIYKGLMSALKRKDKAMRRFANITSHELRAPVASMLGLMQLWDVHQGDDEFRRSIMDKMQECALELDKVTYRLNAELDVKTNAFNPEIEIDRY